MTLIFAILLTLATLFCAVFLLTRPMTYRLQGAVVFVMVITAFGAGLCWWSLTGEIESGTVPVDTAAAFTASGYIPHQRDLP